jgi:CRP-like cAMP-binding protein
MGFWSLFGLKGQEGKKVSFRDTLRSIPIFSELGRRELASVERILHKREYAAGELIFRQDEPGLGMYIIESGRVSIQTDASHNSMTELGDGEFFGELPLLDGGSRSGTAVAKTSCRIFGFFQPDLFSLIERNPRLGVKIVLSLAAIIGMRLRAVNERVQTLVQDASRIAAAKHPRPKKSEEGSRRP